MVCGGAMRPVAGHRIGPVRPGISMRTRHPADVKRSVSDYAGAMRTGRFAPCRRVEECPWPE
jgi:hypothetical protein